MPTHSGLETLLPFAAISDCRSSGQSDSAVHPHLNLTHSLRRSPAAARSCQPVAGFSADGMPRVGRPGAILRLDAARTAALLPRTVHASAGLRPLDHRAVPLGAEIGPRTVARHPLAVRPAPSRRSESIATDLPPRGSRRCGSPPARPLAPAINGEREP
jgi:hypothetical protein